MAACQLRIKLDDAQPRSGGQPVSGTIVVKADKDVNCKGLVVRTNWSTHGRGNVDTGQVGEVTLFQGNWQAGQEYSYTFTLPTAAWPPTYYGTYLNVSHYVSAQAKLAWALDPKAQLEYQVVASDAPEDLKPTAAPPKQAGCLVGTILAVIVLIFVAAFIPFLIFLAIVAAPIVAAIYIFKVVLPKRVTGPATCELRRARVRAGQPVEANLTFTPAQRSEINGIEWTLRCIEECVSGSGSNRKTHTHPIFEKKVRACEAMHLPAGQKQSFDFSFPLPENAAPSLKFSDNKVQWSLHCRIDIPRWPDWTKNLEPIVLPEPVVPVGEAGSSNADLTSKDWSDAGTRDTVMGDVVASGARAPDLESHVYAGQAGMAVPATAKTQADEAWLMQVITQIQQSKHDSQQLALVLAAIEEFEFPVSVVIEDEIDTPEFADETEFIYWDDAEWWSGYLPSQNVEVAVAWAEVTPNRVTPSSTWSGKVSIVGYSTESQRLLLSAN